MQHLVNTTSSSNIESASTDITRPATNTTRVGYKDLNNIMKPDLLESDDSISEWDSESETELDRAAKMLDNNMYNQQPTETDQHSTLVTTQVKTKTVLPRVRAPLPVRIAKIETKATTSTTKSATPIR